MKHGKRNIGQEILESIDDIKSGKGRAYYMDVPRDVKAVRETLKLSQTGLASILGVSVRTLQAWEQGRRSPSGAALALLKIASLRPEVIRTVLCP